MQERKNTKKALIGLLVLILMLSSCKKEVLQPNPAENKYVLYYINTGMTRMTAVGYLAQAHNSEELIQELYDQLMNVPADLDVKSPLSSVELQSFKQEQNVLYLYFDINYTMMSASNEILCRAALTKTLTQVEGVEYLNIYSGDQPLMDAGGKLVGMLSAADFIDSISDVNSYEKSELTLYFSDETGEYLIEERREVMHNINTSMERLIVEQLLEGPETEGCKATIPAETKLLNISITDNVCYLNFDSSFLTNSLEVKEELPIYSLVDSLTQLTTVNRVQFSVNGSSSVLFRDMISLDTLFEQNMDYIKGGDN